MMHDDSERLATHTSESSLPPAITRWDYTAGADPAAGNRWIPPFTSRGGWLVDVVERPPHAEPPVAPSEEFEAVQRGLEDAGETLLPEEEWARPAPEDVRAEAATEPADTSIDEAMPWEMETSREEESWTSPPEAIVEEDPWTSYQVEGVDDLAAGTLSDAGPADTRQWDELAGALQESVSLADLAPPTAALEAAAFAGPAAAGAATPADLTPPGPSVDEFSEEVAGRLAALAERLRAQGFDALGDAITHGDRLEASLALFLAGFRAGRGE